MDAGIGAGCRGHNQAQSAITIANKENQVAGCRSQCGGRSVSSLSTTSLFEWPPGPLVTPIKMFCKNYSHFGNLNALGPNRPSQNEFRKRVPVRLRSRLHCVTTRRVATARQVCLHPLSCDFSVTSLISVFAKLRATSRRDKLPMRNSDLECLRRSGFREKATIRIAGEVCGALPRRRYAMIFRPAPFPAGE